MLRKVLLIGGLLVCVMSAGVYAYSQHGGVDTVPMYEREMADKNACLVAEIAIAGRRAPEGTAFAKDCPSSVVTRLWNRPGFVIVTRTVMEPEPTADTRRQSFSVLLDGRRTDRWRIVDVRSAPSELTFDTSMLR